MLSQSDFSDKSRVSFARKRRSGVPTGKTFAYAFSFMARLAGKYTSVVSMLSWRSQTAMSTPD
jgi:hypothetical protein